MNTLPTDRPARKRQLPKWLKITLSVFGVLFVLGAIFGKSPEKTPLPVAAPVSTPVSTTPSTPSVTPTAPPVERYTVTSVVGGDTVKVTSAGVEKTIHVQGIRTAVPNGTGCFGAETLAWATTTLAGKLVTLGQTALDQAGNTVASLTLPDGGDYSTVALQAGYAVVDGISGSALQTAESAARSGGTGLWGPPCNGNIDAPAIQIQTTVDVPDPPDPEPVTKVTKVSTPKPPAKEPTTTKALNVTYKNCDAARAAGVTPLYRGEPGYSSKLDRDGDGVACE